MSIPGKFSSSKSLFVTARDTAKHWLLTFFPYSCIKFVIYCLNSKFGCNFYLRKTRKWIWNVFNGCKSNWFNGWSKSSAICLLIVILTRYCNRKHCVARATPIYGTSAVRFGSFYVGLNLENFANFDISLIC